MPQIFLFLLRYLLKVVDWFKEGGRSDQEKLNWMVTVRNVDCDGVALEVAEEVAGLGQEIVVAVDAEGKNWTARLIHVHLVDKFLLVVAKIKILIALLTIVEISKIFKV